MLHMANVRGHECTVSASKEDGREHPHRGEIVGLIPNFGGIDRN